MALTLKWWTDLKNNNENKVNGQAAPETEFEKKLKEYDKLRLTLGGLPAVNKALVGLTAVENARKPSMAALKATFPKLSTKCDPNSRVLSTLIAEEKTELETKKKEFAAAVALGPSQMQGLGPAGGNLRQKNFERLQAKIEEVYASLKKTPKLEKATIDAYLTHMKGIEKDVGLYCKDRPAAKQFHDDYVGTVAGFGTVKEKFGSSKGVEALKSIGVQLARLTSAAYIA